MCCTQCATSPIPIDINNANLEISLEYFQFCLREISFLYHQITPDIFKPRNPNTQKKHLAFSQKTIPTIVIFHAK